MSAGTATRNQNVVVQGAFGVVITATNQTTPVQARIKLPLRVLRRIRAIVIVKRIARVLVGCGAVIIVTALVILVRA